MYSGPALLGGPGKRGCAAPSLQVGAAHLLLLLLFTNTITITIITTFTITITAIITTIFTTIVTVGRPAAPG